VKFKTLRVLNVDCRPIHGDVKQDSNCNGIYVSFALIIQLHICLLSFIHVCSMQTPWQNAAYNICQ